MAYNLVQILPEGEQIVTGIDGAPLKFFTAADANMEAVQLSITKGVAVQPRVEPDLNWRNREAGRFVDGTYKHLPWRHEPWYVATEQTADHFAHISKQPGRIAFTENAQKGERDIQTPMLPGRYLTKFYGGVLSTEQIRDLATKFAAQFEVNEVLFAKTPDEIEEVYINGPSSCMSGRLGNGKAPHPVRVYGAGDLAVAYLKSPSGRITARTVCWPEKKIYTRIYGDGDRLQCLLDAAGYNRESRSAGRFHGARLLTLKPEGCSWYVFPDVDFYYSETSAEIDPATGQSILRVICRN